MSAIMENLNYCLTTENEHKHWNKDGDAISVYEDPDENNSYFLAVERYQTCDIWHFNQCPLCKEKGVVKYVNTIDKYDLETQMNKIGAMSILWDSIPEEIRVFLILLSEK